MSTDPPAGLPKKKDVDPPAAPDRPVWRFAYFLGAHPTITLLISVALGAVVWWLASTVDPKRIVEVYETRLSGNLFGGLLTLAGFLFGTATFVFVKLKEGLLDDPGHLDETLRRMRHGATDSTAYKPLFAFVSLAVGAIVLCFLASLAQVSLGILHERHAVLVCLAVSATAVVQTGITLLVHAAFLRFYLRAAEARVIEAHRKKREEEAAAVVGATSGDSPSPQ